MLNTTDITDLQYAVVQCGLTLEMIARRTGATTANILRELQDADTPDWLVAATRTRTAA